MRNTFVAGSIAFAVTLAATPFARGQAAPSWRWADRAPGILLVSAVEDQGGYLALGSHGELLQLRDGVWRLLAVPDRVALSSIWRSPDGDVFATGAHGVVVHRNARGEWSRESVPMPANEGDVLTLQIAGRSARDVWATSGSRVYHRGAAATWSPVALPAGVVITRLRSGARGTFAGTATGLVLELDAARASARVIATMPARAPIHDLRVDSPRNISVSYDGGALRFDGRHWTLEAIGAANRPRHYADSTEPALITDDGVYVRAASGWTPYSYDGSRLLAATVSGATVHALDAAGALVTLTPAGFDVQPAPELDALLCHDTPDAQMLTARFVWHLTPQGAHAEPFAAAPDECRQRWQRQHRVESVADGEVENPVDSQGIPLPIVRARFDRPGERIVLAGEPMRLERESLADHARTTLGDPWTLASWPGPALFLGGLPDANADVWIGGANYLVRMSHGHFERFYLGARSDDRPLQGIASAGSELYAYGEDWQVLHWTGTVWNPEVTPSAGVSDVTTVGGRAALRQQNMVSVRRDDGRFASVRSDGSLRAALEGNDFGRVDALWGTAPDNVYATSGALLFHGNGHDWTRERTFSDEDLLALSGTEDSIYAVGRRGRIVARHGEHTQPEPAGTRADLHAVLALPGGEAYAVGLGVIVHRTAQGWHREFPADGESPATALDLRSVFAWDGHLHAVASSGHVLVRGEHGWTPMGADDALHGLDALTLRETDSEPDFPSELSWHGGPSAHVERDGYDGDDESAPNESVDLRQLNSDEVEQRRRLLAISPCAAVIPRPGTLLVLSCRNDEIAKFEAGQWTTVRLPARVGIRGAACIPGGECYVFTSAGTLVGEGL